MAVVMDKQGREVEHEAERFTEEVWRRCLCIGM